MNRDDLVRKLNSVGKQAFIEHYDLFRMYASGQTNRDRAIDQLVSLGVSNESGAGIRLSNARLIFTASREADAIDIVLASMRMPPETTNEARRLRSELG